MEIFIHSLSQRFISCNPCGMLDGTSFFFGMQGSYLMVPRTASTALFTSLGTLASHWKLWNSKIWKEDYIIMSKLYRWTGPYTDLSRNKTYKWVFSLLDNIVLEFNPCRVQVNFDFYMLPRLRILVISISYF